MYKCHEPQKLYKAAASSSIATGSKFSSYGINYPSSTSGTSFFIEELNSESLSQGREGVIEREDMLLFPIFPYFPSSHFFSYITCCDYDVTEKPVVVISRALQACGSSNGGRDFMVFSCLFQGIARLDCKKFRRFMKLRVLIRNYRKKNRKRKYEIFVAVAL